jgi:hypothetical protein
VEQGGGDDLLDGPGRIHAARGRRRSEQQGLHPASGGCLDDLDETIAGTTGPGERRVAPERSVASSAAMDVLGVPFAPGTVSS